MTGHTVTLRSVQRLLGRVREDIGQAERCRAGRSRREFAGDPMRRDAVEQYLRRVGVITAQLAAVDGHVRARLGPILHVLRPLCTIQPLDRMDTEVLCGLVDLCAIHLRPEIEQLLQRRPSPTP